MDIFDALTMIGGLSLFLFGMNIMGQALERRAGEKLRSLLGKLTTNKLAGLLTGLVITAAIQSSSAATVMVVGFVKLRSDDAGAGDPCDHGRKCGDHRDRMDLKPGRDRQRKPVRGAAKALLLHAGSGVYWHHLLYVQQKRQEKGAPESFFWALPR